MIIKRIKLENYTVFNIETESNILIYEEAEQDDWM